MRIGTSTVFVGAVLGAAVAALAQPATPPATTEKLVSPDGRIEGTLSIGEDYRRRVVTVSPGAVLRLDLAPGGGAALRLRRR